jgi:MFS family permease
MGIYASFPLLAGTLGDFLGGWISDHWLRRTGNLTAARRVIGCFGFAVAAAAIVPAALTDDAMACVWFNCVALFGLELTVGVSWAVPLDIGGDYAGSVSSVMNTCGNMGGTISPAIYGYIVQNIGWNEPFLVASVVCAIGAALYLKIDAGRRVVFAESQ